MGTVIAGWISVEAASILVLCVAAAGWFAGRQVEPAPRMGPELKLDFNPITASWRLVNGTMHIPRLFLAICAISFFWAIGAVLIIIFPPLVKNLLTADKEVASLVIAVFSIGVAIGSVIINSMLKGRISAKYGPPSVIVMGGFVVAFSIACRMWTPAPPGHFYSIWEFIAQPKAALVVGSLTAIAITGGMFVVPPYAFLTTTVSKDQTARTVAAKNVVNSGAMVLGSVFVISITALGVSPQDMLLIVAGMCLISAWIAQKLHQACD
jgi:hypothetical protein